MNKKKETVAGIAQGKVAKKLRQLLYKDFTESQVETITVVLLCHLMVENTLNKVIFELLIHHLLRFKNTKRDEEMNEKMIKAVRKNIEKMPFIRKLEIIKPGLESFIKGLSAMLRDINRVRNEISHGRIFGNGVIFEKKDIWEEDTLWSYFECCYSGYDRLLKFYQMIHNDRAVRRRSGKRRKELGEPL